jgi:hypothetical protein
MFRMAMLVVSGLALTAPAPAQSIVSQDGSQDNGKSFFDVVKPDDLKNFCIFRNEAYSIGSFACEGRQANVCAGPNDPPPAGTNNMGRAYWKSQRAEQICAQ